MVDPICEQLKIGDKVHKVSGYKYPGTVVAVFRNLKGDDRYVVECTVPEVAGMLHIYNRSQLELDEGESMNNNEWQPIEIAPSNTEVLCTFDHKGTLLISIALYMTPFTQLYMNWNCGDIDPDYDPKTDQYYVPAGWFESIKHFPELGYIECETNPVAWMPLPEIPSMLDISKRNQLEIATESAALCKQQG